MPPRPPSYIDVLPAAPTTASAAASASGMRSGGTGLRARRVAPPIPHVATAVPPPPTIPDEQEQEQEQGEEQREGMLGQEQGQGHDLNPHELTVQYCLAKALYTYAGEGDDEIQFNAGDVIEITKQHASGWWQGVYTTQENVVS